MSFLPLDSEADLERAVEASHARPVLLFKHSAACPISAAAQASLNRLSEQTDPDVYRLVVQHARSLSNAIAQRFGVRHESPQLLVLHGGAVHAHASHYGVTADWARAQMEVA